MKKKIIIAVAVVVGLIALVCTINILRGHWLVPAQIQRVEFQGHDSCSGPVSKTVELNNSEIRRMVAYYNLASYAGRVDAEGCDSEFSFNIYLKDGTRIHIREAYAPRIEVKLPQQDKYWINSTQLANFAQELIEKYDLTVS